MTKFQLFYVIQSRKHPTKVKHLTEENIIGVILLWQVDASAVPVVVRALSEPSVVNRSSADCQSRAAELSKSFPWLPPRELVVSLAPPYYARLAQVPPCDAAAPPAHDLLAPGQQHHSPEFRNFTPLNTPL